jgi:hypothetical protein
MSRNTTVIYILILSSHLHVDVSNGLLCQAFQITILYESPSTSQGMIHYLYNSSTKNKEAMQLKAFSPLELSYL